MALSVEQKVSIVSGSDEIIMAVKILIVLMEDADLKNHVTLEYELNGENYKLAFTKA